MSGATADLVLVPANEASFEDLQTIFGAFAAAGLEEVSHPTPRRVVMRIELDPTH